MWQKQPSASSKWWTKRRMSRKQRRQFERWNVREDCRDEQCRCIETKCSIHMEKNQDTGAVAVSQQAAESSKSWMQEKWTFLPDIFLQQCCQHSSPTLLYNPLLQNLLQHFWTTLPYNTFVQHFSTTLFSNTSLRHSSSSTLFFNTLL